MTKKFDSETDIDELTDTQQRIIEHATENPDWTYEQISNAAECSESYVGTVHREYITEKLEPDLVSWEDVDDELYESIVAGLEAQDDVDRVEQKYDLELSEGGSKEVDVAVWKNLEHHELLIIIECKFHEDPIEQEVVSGMIRNQQNSRANHTVLVSKSGFQEGAISQARDAGVDLYTLKELEEQDADGFIQNIQFDINIRKPGVTPLEIQLSPIGYKPEGLDSQGKLSENPYLWNEDYTHLGIRLMEYLTDIAHDKEPGIYRETMEDKLICIDGTFCQIDFIEYEKQPQKTSKGYEGEIDLFDEKDLVMIDELDESEEDRTFYSLEDVLNAFVSEAKASESGES